jgi:hypothetical protein
MVKNNMKKATKTDGPLALEKKLITKLYSRLERTLLDDQQASVHARQCARLLRSGLEPQQGAEHGQCFCAKRGRRPPAPPSAPAAPHPANTPPCAGPNFRAGTLNIIVNREKVTV